MKASCAAFLSLLPIFSSPAGASSSLLPLKPLLGFLTRCKSFGSLQGKVAKRPRNFQPFVLDEDNFRPFSLTPLTTQNRMDLAEKMGDHGRYLSRFRRFRRDPYLAPHIQKILLVSDLHCDYEANREWLSGLSPTGDHNSVTNEHKKQSIGKERDFNLNTMILVAGDVSHDLSILRWTFKTLKKKFGEVAFVPGNHELWIDRRENGDGCSNSVQKIETIMQICIEEEVHIGPVKCSLEKDETNQTRDLWVVPLLSWYHSSFDTEPPIDSACWGGIPSAQLVVADYRRAAWPEPLSPLDESVARFMDDLNDIILNFDFVEEESSSKSDKQITPVLTFSHFLPRIELLPEKRYLSLPTLHSCVGSTFLEKRLRQIACSVRNNSSIQQSNSEIDDISQKVQHLGVHNIGANHLHAFGHSHLSWDATIEGVRYIHVPLAYPREWEQRRKSLEIGTMKGEIMEKRYPVCIWDRRHDPTMDDASSGSVEHDAQDRPKSESKTPRVHKYNNGFPKAWLGGWWSKYYNHIERQPHRNKELAPWVARRFRQLPEGVVEHFDHDKMERQHRLQHPSHWTSGTLHRNKR